MQQKLTQATVAIVGLSGAGAEVALALANSGVGTLRCIDSLPVDAADSYLSPTLGMGTVGEARASAVAAAIHRLVPEVSVVPWTEVLESETALRLAIAGANFVVCCLDSSQANLIFKLNRVCLTDGIGWIVCSLSGAEIAIGPAMQPGHGPCFLCYRMRSVACAGNPHDAFAYEKYLDRRRCDDSARRENLVFGAGLAANILGLEVMKALTRFAEPSLTGRLLTVRLTDLMFEHHTVLRKPGCPACSSNSQARHGT
jgi:adenylyltransferase/sulfurtransferase